VWDAPKELTEEQIKALPGWELLRPEKVRASHILVKHSGSRRPSSWKEASRRSFAHHHDRLAKQRLSVSPISRARRKRPSRSWRDTTRRSGGTQTSLACSRASTRTVPPTTTMETWAGLDRGRCRSRSRMRHFRCGWVRLVASSIRRAGFTSSCAPSDRIRFQPFGAILRIVCNLLKTILLPKDWTCCPMNC
jgi:hypothetical protein